MDWTSTAGVALLGSMVGAGAALLGVLITNAFNTIGQWRQRKHDATQKAIDRISIMRREVYLDAVDMCVAALSELPSLITEGNQAKRQEILGGVGLAMTKVQVVCAPSTATAAQVYGAEFAAVYQRLILAANDARNLEIDIGLRQQLVDEAARKMRGLEELMHQYNVAQRNEPQYLQGLLSVHGAELAQHRQYAAEVSGLHDSRNRAMGIYQGVMLKELAALNECQRVLLDCIRDELGLTPQSASDVAKRLELEAATRAQLAKLSDAFAAQGNAALDVLAEEAVGKASAGKPLPGSST